MNKVRVLYSFPHKLGADRICYTAWQQVNGLSAAGAQVIVQHGRTSERKAVAREDRTDREAGDERAIHNQRASERAVAA